MQRRLFPSPRLLAGVVLALVLGACDTQLSDEDTLSTRFFY